MLTWSIVSECLTPCLHKTGLQSLSILSLLHSSHSTVTLDFSLTPLLPSISPSLHCYPRFLPHSAVTLNFSLTPLLPSISPSLRCYSRFLPHSAVTLDFSLTPLLLSISPSLHCRIPQKFPRGLWSTRHSFLTLS